METPTDEVRFSKAGGTGEIESSVMEGAASPSSEDGEPEEPELRTTASTASFL